jgi:hypothetical protein
VRLVRTRGWGLTLAVLATLGGLAVAGRLLDLPMDPQPGIPSPPPSTTVRAVTVTTLPPGTIPAALRRPLRLPSLRRDGSCPTSPAVGPPMTTAKPVAAVAVGDGPVFPVLFRATADGRLDRSAVAYWDAPTPLGGPAIIRGHRLGAPRDRVRFQDDEQQSRLVHVLDPVLGHPAGPQGRWWRPTRLRAGAGCYGLQIDGPVFTQVLVVEFA